MNDAAIETLRALEARASPGPWGASGDGTVHGQDPDNPIVLEHGLADDATFVAAARNAIVPLLKRLAEAEGKGGRA